MTLTSIIALTTRLNQNVTSDLSIKLTISLPMKVGQTVTISGTKDHNGAWRVAEVVTEEDGSPVYKCHRPPRPRDVVARPHRGVIPRIIFK